MAWYLGNKAEKRGRMAFERAMAGLLCIACLPHRRDTGAALGLSGGATATPASRAAPRSVQVSRAQRWVAEPRLATTSDPVRPAVPTYGQGAISHTWRACGFCGVLCEIYSTLEARRMLKGMSHQGIKAQACNFPAILWTRDTIDNEACSASTQTPLGNRTALGQMHYLEKLGWTSCKQTFPRVVGKLGKKHVQTERRDGKKRVVDGRPPELRENHFRYSSQTQKTESPPTTSWQHLCAAQQKSVRIGCGLISKLDIGMGCAQPAHT